MLLRSIFVIVVHTLILSPHSVMASSGILSGTVIDKATNQPISNASVEILNTTIGDEADSTGAFILENLETGTYRIRISRIGYEELIQQVTLAPGEMKILNFYLSSTTVPLRGIEVKAERLWQKYLTEASLVNVQKMSAKDIIAIPGAIDDPLRAIQVYSGVFGGGDYSGFLAVRGGSPDQNQVIVDGITIPSPYRFRMAFGGGLSSINPNTTRDMYLHLGGFSAEYGNSLSSILEVESRIGNRKGMSAQGNVNLTDVNGVIEGPTPLANGSFLFSVRRTYYDFIINDISKTDSAFPFYFEISNRLTFDIDEKNRIFINFVRNREGAELLDEFSEDLNISETGTTYLTSILWRRLQSERLQFDAALSYYNDVLNYRAFPSDSLNKVDFYESLDAKIVNMKFKGDVRYQTGDESWLKWGVSVAELPTRVNFESPDFSFFYSRVESPNQISFDETYRNYASYIESSTKATDRLHFRLGARFDYSTLLNKSELSPRFSLWYKLSDRTSLEGSFGIFYQFPDAISVYSRNIPINLSLNLDVISAEKATHEIIGIEHFFNDDISATLQIYNKDFDRVLLPLNEQTFAPANNGVGFSRGFELIVQKRPSHGKFSSILSYSYGNAKYRAIDAEKWLPFKYDRRHALSFLSNTRIVGNWNLSILGQYATGYPSTEILGLRNILTGDGTVSFDFIHGGRFESRLPAFKRIDARLSYQRRLGSKGISFYLDVINLTNEKNVHEITWEKKYLPDDRQQATRRVIYMLPIIPSIGVNFRM